MTLDATAIGGRILKVRNDKGLSQKELADKVRALGLAGVRISAAYISRIERGERVPSSRVLDGVATVLGTTAAYLEEGQLWWTVVGIRDDTDRGFIKKYRAQSAKDAELKAIKSLSPQTTVLVAATFAGRLAPA